MSFATNPKPSKARSRYPRWTLRSGAKVRLEDMTSTHIGRAIRHCEERARKRYPIFIAECYEARGMTEADFVAEQELLGDDLKTDNWQVCLHPMYEHLVAEAKRRGIDVEGMEP